MRLPQFYFSRHFSAQAAAATETSAPSQPGAISGGSWWKVSERRRKRRGCYLQVLRVSAAIVEEYQGGGRALCPACLAVPKFSEIAGDWQAYSRQRAP